ncbi:MAG: pyruvate kinase [Planctomycetales bacterium]
MTTTRTSGLVGQAHTKIVATLGPASSEEDQLAELVQAGVDVFRVNMAHGDREEHETVVSRIRNVSERLNRPIGILVDLAGPKIRLGELTGDPVDCPEGGVFRFVRGDRSEDPQTLVSNYERLIDELAVGDEVRLADGIVAMTVISKRDDSAEAKVSQGGRIRSRQGINLPGVKLSQPALTAEDRENAVWAASVEVDFLGMSFVRDSDDVRQLRELLQNHNLAKHIPRIVAKIEKREALVNLEEIVREADAVMVARGDLGVEIDVARLAVEQKRIISTCSRHQKPVITATQMLDSMQRSRYPTRAEATDVANALLDGTDACMLSQETAVGEYPVEAARMMNRIALMTEPLLRDGSMKKLPDIRPAELNECTLSMAYAAGRIAEDLEAKLIVVGSHTGASALALSSQRRFVPVVGVSDSPSTLRQMCLYWGVTPLSNIPIHPRNKTLPAIEDWGRERGVLNDGDRIVVLASSHIADSGHDVVAIHEVGRSNPAAP